MAEIKRIFMFDRDEDAALEKRNTPFWLALLGHVQADRAIDEGGTILDIGCHQGGLLSLSRKRFKAVHLIGVEPIKAARDLAQARLQREGVSAKVLRENEWRQIGDQSVDLVLSHEVLPFIQDLDQLIANIQRVLKPHAFAYVVSGCHLENPLWPIWREELQSQGHVTYDHSPIALMEAAGKQGLSPSVRTLRDHGWAHYNPAEEAAFAYPSVEALLDHQFKYKLLFRFQRMA
jgi:SAM-dependent methyltransferase